VPVQDQRSVRAGTIWADLVFLHTVINWACKWRTVEGHYLMQENPARGYPMPKEKNPRRPVATQDRFEKVRAVAEQVTVAIGQGKHRRDVRSYLPEILDVAAATGRRISAILALRYQDLRLDHGPLGAIRWPANTDKVGREWLVPVNAQVRAALDRVLADRPGIGAAYLFPSAGNPTKPVSKELASAWLRKAEELAVVPKQDGSLWHAYRRKWATERKHLPDVDVAAAGGWTDTATLRTVYQQADAETMFRVVSEPLSLRKLQRG
jgi:integrase